MKAVLLIGKNIESLNFNFNNSYVVGVDQGITYALKHDIKLNLAIGDFDSFDATNIKLDCPVIRLNPIKDSTDTMIALEYVKTYEEVYILGGIAGGRIEHFIANYKMLYNNQNIVLLDDNNKIFIVPNQYTFKKSKYKYYSFFAMKDVSNLTLKGFKYPLQDYDLKIYDPLCISNELIQDIGTLVYSEGLLVCVLSMEDNNTK